MSDTSVKFIQALMTGLVALACIVGGIILMLSGIDGKVGAGLLIIACGYLGIDLVPFIPLGKARKRKKED